MLAVKMERGIPEEKLGDAVDILLEAFAEKIANELRPHSPEQAARIIKASINPDLGQVVLSEEGEVLGVIGIASYKKAFSHIPLALLLREFGFFGAIPRWVLVLIEDLFRAKRGEWRIEVLAVREGFRAKGVGTMLLKATIEAAKREGVKALTIEVVDTNPGAKSLYERLGFKKTREIKTGWLTAGGGYRGFRLMRLQL